MSWAPLSSHTLTVLLAITIGILLYAGGSLLLKLDEAVSLWRALKGSKERGDVGR